jgi:hypothetical protein
MTVYRNVEVTLIENSSAGNPPKIFSAQNIEIDYVPDTVKTSVDGILSTASHPSTILWHGAKASDFKHVTNIKVAHRDGSVLFNGAIIRHYQAPHDVSKGVELQAM